MSNWTHVAGVIRIDSFRFDDGTPDFDKLIGKEMPWEGWRTIGEKEWNKAFKSNQLTYLPMGSEGSIQKTVWINPDEHCLAAFTITLFGDLRDHNNPDDVIKWFKKIINRLEKNHLGIRQAMITVENENNGTKSYIYKD